MESIAGTFLAKNFATKAATSSLLIMRGNNRIPTNHIAQHCRLFGQYGGSSSSKHRPHNSPDQSVSHNGSAPSKYSSAVHLPQRQHHAHCSHRSPYDPIERRVQLESNCPLDRPSIDPGLLDPPLIDKLFYLLALLPL